MPQSTRNSTCLLVVAAPGVDLSQARRVRARLAAAWPSESQVTIDAIALAGPDEEGQRSGGEPRLAFEQVASQVYGHQALLVLSSGPVLTPDVLGLLDRAARQEVPVIRLVAGGERRERREFWSAARGGSVPVLALDADPGLVAGLALGLISAAHARRELAAELEVERAVKDSAAKLLEHNQSESALAVLVQRALLPIPPRDIPGLDTGVLYRPCCALSGDLYDIVRLDHDHVAFFLADACGHGVAAALLTMLIGRLLPMTEPLPVSTEGGRGGVGGAGGVRIIPPGEAMARLNAAYIQRQPESSRLITAIYGVLHLPTGRLTIASAGHPPAAITGPDGLRLAGESGPSLGLMDDAEFPDTVVSLAPGERVMLYSDGFEWAFDDASPQAQNDRRDRRKPNERYLDAFRLLGGRSDADLPAALFDLTAEMDRQSGSLHQPDDVTLLAFQWGRSAAAANPLPLAA